jgi:hypothetical protein
MSLISLVAEAASDILRQIGDGTLKIDGIVLRDAKGKIRYILRGFENLPNDSLRLADHPSLQPLRAVLQLQPILQLVMIAQNAATAASLHRIGDRLSDIDLRIRKMGANLNLLALLKLNNATALLKGAKLQAKVAIKDRERGALIASVGSATEAAHDILGQAKQLAHQMDDDGLPAALGKPQEFCDVVGSVADAFEVASAILVACEQPGHAADLLKEAATTLKNMRQRIAACYDDPELMLRRSRIDANLDSALAASGRTLRDAIHRCEGRQWMIELGVIGPDPNRQELETAIPQEGLAFQAVPENMHVDENPAG